MATNMGEFKAGAIVHPSEEEGVLCDYRPQAAVPLQASNCGVFADWLVDGAFVSVAACDRCLPRACREASDG